MVTQGQKLLGMNLSELNTPLSGKGLHLIFSCSLNNKLLNGTSIIFYY